MIETFGFFFISTPPHTSLLAYSNHNILEFFFLLGFLTSLKASIKYKRPDLLLSMHPVFLIIHLSYGTGLIIEMLKRFKKNKFVEQKGNLAKIRIVLLENYQEKSLPVNK